MQAKLSLVTWQVGVVCLFAADPFLPSVKTVMMIYVKRCTAQKPDPEKNLYAFNISSVSKSVEGESLCECVCV